MSAAPLVFMDTETTGLSLDADIWEFAAIRREVDGTESELHLFIEHDRAKCAGLPQPFRDDHYGRYLDHHAVSQLRAANAIMDFIGEGDGPRAHVVGAVPNFDTERIALLCERQGYVPPAWHYHLIDVENLAVGYLVGHHKAIGKYGVHRGIVTPEFTVALPWDSNILSKQVGVDPERFERHTAMGDVRWVMAIYDAITSVEER